MWRRKRERGGEGRGGGRGRGGGIGEDKSQSLQNRFKAPKWSAKPSQHKTHYPPTYFPSLLICCPSSATFFFLLLLECTRHTHDLGLSLKLFLLPQMLFLQVFLGLIFLLSSSLFSNVTFSVWPTYHYPPLYTTYVSHTLILPPQTPNFSYPTLLILSWPHITFKHII